MKKIFLTVFLSTLFLACGSSKTGPKTPTATPPKVISSNPINNGYWQQHVDYNMDIDMNVNNYQYKGKQKLVYTNNSPDVLEKVYYHLYFNAFQPGSEMDIRSRTIKDPDSRVGDRISKLTPSEIGYIKVASLQQDGGKVQHKTIGTILEVVLNKPLQPGASTTLEMIFDGQVPKQIRRSGRNNKEGVALSMTQWYPKLAEYDIEGWHADAYIAREFHGVWGDFDVTIHIDKDYTLGGSGYLQNPQEIGHGYAKNTTPKVQNGKLAWHFVAPNVHDFTWAADANYIHDTYQVKNGPILHFLYKDNLTSEEKQSWKKLQPKTADLMNYYSEHIGTYPYKQYSVIQGGDGGMEYAMCTLITGKRSFGSLVGVTAHEMAHTWFQFLLATNESKHPWMDEGFTTYISSIAENIVLNEGKDNPIEGLYNYYYGVVGQGLEESMSTHADRFNTNRAYSMASYGKGCLFLGQLEYIIGKENTAKTLKKYFTDFRFKHPTPNDIKRTAEKVLGVQLGWYLNEWTQTTHTIDYAIKNVEGKQINLERIGTMPMPIDLTVTYTDGTSENYYIPLRMMLGQKPTTATVVEAWAWANPAYQFTANKVVKSVEIDTSGLLADIDKTNNTFGK